MKRSGKSLAVLLTLAILGIGSLVSTAGAKPKAWIYWTPAATANEGQSVPFIWRGKYFGGHYKVVIERPFGTSHVWKGIMQLDASGKGTLPGMKMGVHWLRIAVFNGGKLIAQQVKVIKVFGTVPFTTLLDSQSPSVYTAGSHSFSYVTSETVWQDGGTRNIFGVSNNNCSSVHVAFMPGEHPEQGIGTLTVVQESRDPTSASISFDEPGAVDAQLTPGQTWGVNASIAKGYGATFYINGYATCYSGEPFHK